MTTRAREPKQKKKRATHSSNEVGEEAQIGAAEGVDLLVVACGVAQPPQAVWKRPRRRFAQAAHVRGQLRRRHHAHRHLVFQN